MKKLIFILCLLLFFGCEQKTSERKLVALSNKTETHGSFFIGTGSINSEMKYIYLYRSQDNGIRQDYSTPACSTIYEVESEPKIIQRTREWCKCHWCSFYYIPKNSVKKIYNIDIDKGD